MSAKALTKIHCKAQGATKALAEEVAVGKKIQSALKVSSDTKDSRAEVTAGYWTRDTPHKLTCMAYVSNMASIRLRAKPKAQVSAHSSSDSTKPVAHAFEFSFVARQSMTGTLTLTISGACSQGATDQYEILVTGDGWSKRLTSSSEKHFRKLVLNKVSLGPKGLKIQIKSLAVAVLSKKGHCQTLGRASIRFDVIKK